MGRGFQARLLTLALMLLVSGLPVSPAAAIESDSNSGSPEVAQEAAPEAVSHAVNGFATGTDVVVAAETGLAGIDAHLEGLGTISGTLTDLDTGFAVPYQCIYAYDSDPAYVTSACADESGFYSIPALADGDYFLFSLAGTHLGQWYDGASLFDDATPVSVVSSGDVTGIDFVLDDGVNISGVVTAESDGTPLANITVAAYAQGLYSLQQIKTVTTATDGSYTISGLAPGDYKVGYLDYNGVYRNEYYDNVLTGLAEAPFIDLTGGDISGIDAGLIALPASGVTGYVFDDLNNPLPGIEVYVNTSLTFLGPDEPGADQLVLPKVVTDADGFFDLAGVATIDGGFELVFIDPLAAWSTWYYRGYSFTTDPGVIVAESLHPAVPLIGIVSDELGPVAGATVWYNVGTHSITSTTSGDGSYTLPGYSDELIGSVRVASPDHVPSGGVGIQSNPLDIMIFLAVALSGNVTDSSGTPLGGIAVSGTKWVTAVVSGTLTTGPNPGFHTHTDVDGNWSVRVKSAAYSVSFTTDGYAPQGWGTVALGERPQALGYPEQDFLIAQPGQIVAGLDAVLGAGSSISGDILVAGSPNVSQAEISVLNSEGIEVAGSQASSTFSIGGLPPGSYTVHVRRPHGWSPLDVIGSGVSSQVEIPQSGMSVTGVDVTLPILASRNDGGSVGGTIGTGFDYVSLEMLVPDPIGSEDIIYKLSVPTSDAGIYLIEDVPAGSYVVKSSNGTYFAGNGVPGVARRSEAITVTVGAGSLTGGVDFSALEVAAVAGEVSDVSGLAQSTGIWIHAYDLDGVIVSSSELLWQGGPVSYNLVLLPGIYRIQAQTYPAAGWYGGGSSLETAGTLVVSEADVAGVDFTIDAGGGVLGTITDASSGLGIEGAAVILYDDQGELSWVAGTNSAGEYTMPNDVGDAVYHFEVRHPDYGSEWFDDTTPRHGVAPVSHTFGDWTVVDLALNPDIPAELLFVPIEPCAVFDTRFGTGEFAGPIGGGSTLGLQVAGAAIAAAQGGSECSPPPNEAVAIMLNLVGVGPLAAGNLKVSERGIPANGGVVNFSPDRGTNSSAVPVKLDGSGFIDVAVNSASDQAVHVRGVALGYYVDPNVTPGVGVAFIPIEPCAVYDSRSATGEFGGKFDPGEIRTFNMSGGFDPDAQGASDCVAPPSGAKGVMVNLVAVNPTRNGNIKIVESGGVAGGGVVNFGPGRSNSNAVPIAVDLNGRVDVVINASGASATHIRAVVLGYYVDDTHADAGLGLAFVATEPCAVFDTRFATAYEQSGFQDGGTTLWYKAAGYTPDRQGAVDCAPPPPSAEAVMINLVAINPQVSGNFRISTHGVDAAGGVVNFDPTGGTNSNAVPVALDPYGDVDVYVNTGGTASTHVRGVTLGYYVPAGF